MLGKRLAEVRRRFTTGLRAGVQNFASSELPLELYCACICCSCVCWIGEHRVFSFVSVCCIGEHSFLLWPWLTLGFSESGDLEAEGEHWGT
jgi:hypothetical protein